MVNAIFPAFTASFKVTDNISDRFNCAFRIKWLIDGIEHIKI